MSILEAIILGIVQGLAEFLPISSSGHIVLANELLDTELEPENAVAVNVMMHLGSLVAILIVFRKDILRLFLPKPNWKQLALLAYLSIPAGLVGLLLGDWLEGIGYMDSPLVVFVALFFTAGLLLLAERKQKEDVEWQGLSGINWWLAIFVGLAQAIAITPGISRSGATIATALLLGWVRGDAVRLSFLIGLIAIGGAGLLKAGDISDLEVAPVTAGFVSSLVFSLIGLAGIRFVVRERKLKWFAAYCALVGTVGLIWYATGV